MTAPQILLDPVDFDALHLSALAFGGIGWGKWHEQKSPGEYIPCCWVGHCADVGVVEGVWASKPLGLGECESDGFVTEGKLCPNSHRISWDTFIERANIDVKAVA